VVDSATHSRSALEAFSARHTSLLDALASVWTVENASRFTWLDPVGHTLYSSGSPGDGVIQAWLAHGTLNVEGCDVSRQPVLIAQARLLQEAIDRDLTVDLLTDELMRTTDQLVALYEVSAAARAGHDLDVMMQTCVEQAARLTGAEHAMLTIRESARAEDPLRVFTYPLSDLAGMPDPHALLSALTRNPAPAILNSPEECSAVCDQAVDAVRRVALAPIPIAGKIDAGLCVANKPSDFISGDLKLITALADAAAGFLERDRNYRRELAQARLRRELEIAADIQSRLLPRTLPTLPGVQLAAVSQPASEVGGDFFDVQVLPGDVLALAVGDVTGRGVPAALFMAMALALLRVGLRSTRSPGEAVRHLNAGLSDDLANTGMFVTLFVATFDPASGELRAVNCGHSPVLVCRRGEVEIWEADGPPVGVLPGVLSAELWRKLQPGDVLAVLSDGFSDARGADGRRIGIAPLVEAVRRSADQDAAMIVTALQACVETAGRGPAPEDDQTLVVMKVE
jgi:phosphoserine phosphatase RsbU/P